MHTVTISIHQFFNIKLEWYIKDKKLKRKEEYQIIFNIMSWGHKHLRLIDLQAEF